MPLASTLPLANQASMPTPAKPTNRSVWILTLITIAGAWLRFSHIGAKSLWLDEGATVTLARVPWQRFQWIWWHGEANLQTVYFLMMRGWVHLGSSEAFLRAPSAIFGTLAIPLLYVVTRKFTGVTASLAAAALLAFSPTGVYYSQEARSYSLAIVMVLLATYFFVRAVEENRPADWALWTVFGIASFYSHDLAALVLLAQAVSILFKAPPVPWRRVIVCGAIIFVAALPGLTYIFRATPENLHFIWMPKPSAKEVWHLAMFYGGSGAKVGMAIVLWAAGVVTLWTTSRYGTPDARWRGALVMLWAILPAFVLALVSLRQPMFLQRYMIFSMPALMLLAGIGVGNLRKWRVGLILVIVLCASASLTIVRKYNKPREDWRGASNLVFRSATPGDAVAFFPFYQRIMMDYYAGQSQAGAPPLHVFAPAFYDGGEDASTLLQTLISDPQQFRHVWILMADHGTKLEYFDHGAAVQAKLQEIYGPPTVQKFADIDVLQFGK
jgi:mannosyltransferase